jgi:drug/metabolite transporter (DMT)-like permease
MALLLLFVTTVVWGSTFVIIKDTVRTVDPFLLVAVRNLQAAAAMSLWLLMSDRRALLDRDAWRRGLPLGFLLAATYASQSIGLRFTSVGHSAFITGSAVVMVPVILFFVLRERLTLREWLCVLAVFVGLFLLAFDFQTRINTGDALTLICALSYAVHIILAGRFVKCTSGKALIHAQFVWSAVASLLFYALWGRDTGMPAARAWGSLIYLGLVGTLFCYFVAVWAQKVVSAMQVMIIFALEPVFAALFGYWLCREVLYVREWLGAVVMLAGVVTYQLLEGRRMKPGTSP